MNERRFATRPAVVADAEPLAMMWQRSIRELCHRDHHGRAEVIAAWCAEKTTPALAAALAEPTLYWLVAIGPADAIVGVGLLGPGGLIHAIYVDPTAVGHGVGSRLLSDLEREIRRRSVSEISLESTTTAHRFYRKHGFVDAGSPIVRFGGVIAHPMRKVLDSGH